MPLSALPDSLSDMRIDQLTLRNFKAFEELTIPFARSPNASADGNGSFHVLIGENGVGKTSALEGLAVAVGSWFLGIPGYDSRNIRREDARISIQKFGDTLRSEPQYPVSVRASGRVNNEAIDWERSLQAEKGRTDRANALTIQKIAQKSAQSVMKNEGVTLPLISYFGTGRLWLEPRDMKNVRAKRASKKRPRTVPQETANELDNEPDFGSRLTGYRFSIDPRCNPRDLLQWLLNEKRFAADEGKDSTHFVVVKEAIRKCLEHCKSVDFHLRLGTLLIELEGRGQLPFGNLSDGQRNMVGMIGDLAFKAAQLNPHLGTQVLEKTPGIVLIDELDLHLHPSWQRHVVTDLQRAFPEVQFIATTHSPQLISEVQPESLIVLMQDDVGRVVAANGTQSYGLDSNWVLEHIMGVPSRPQPAVELIRVIEDALELGNLDAARNSLAELRRLLHGDDGDVARLEATINNLEALADAPDSEES